MTATLIASRILSLEVTVFLCVSSFPPSTRNFSLLSFGEEAEEDEEETMAASKVKWESDE